jgi:hypothetical protein
MSTAATSIRRFVQPSGVVRFRRTRTRRSPAAFAPLWQPIPVGLSWKYYLRSLRLELALRARIAAKGFWRGLVAGQGVVGVGRLHATVHRADGRIERLGLIATRLITDNGVAFLVDDWDNNAQDLTTLNYHGCGTGTTAEAQGDSALVTESTTALNPDSTRATGTRSQPAANQYRTVGTVTFDASAAVTEHGIFSQAATGGGTLWDRSVFAAINVVSGDSIQFTYTATMSAGG